jgi:AraC-like DNA-binding protein
LQGARETAFGDGEAILLSCAERSFSIPRPTTVHFVGLRVPRKRLEPFVTGLDDQIMRVVPAANELLRLLRGYLGALVEGTIPSQAEAAALVGNHLIDLTSLTLGGTAEANRDANGVRAARLQAAKAGIARKLFDGGLAIDDIARAQCVTPRYLQKLFEAEGKTFTQHVTEQRLARAYRMLRDPRYDRHNISTLAYEVGFNDLSYFNRVFRRRYGETPSGVRANKVSDPK